jgi:DMSO/TMAO reductase YedYZ molybdopterin-dependent catalytic subunit
MTTPLPPGQRERPDFPRFGLTPFATRFPSQTDRIDLHVGFLDSSDAATPSTASSTNVGPQLTQLPRVEQTSDFHCVTTWTRRGLRWGGVRFADFYQQIVVPLCPPNPASGQAATDPAAARFVVLRAQDGARTSLPLEDLLSPDVLLADHLDGQPLPIEHGAPLRLIAPAHYGYKSVKHLHRIEFWRSDEHYRPYGLRFMVHPRARVAFEERGQWVPGWLLRHLYRPLIGMTVARFERGMREREL